MQIERNMMMISTHKMLSSRPTVTLFPSACPRRWNRHSLDFNQSNTSLRSKPIFNETHYLAKPITLDEVDCLIEITKKMNMKDRESVFFANGIHYNNVEKYYRYVLSLETKWRQDNNNSILTSFINALVLMHSKRYTN